MTLRVGSLFSGVGGLDLAVEAFFGAQTVWHCEWDAEPSKVLEQHWPGVPNHRDVTTVDWSTVEPVDIMCGGFPCQDVSLAGRRAGMKAGTRSGLWSEFARAIDIVKPEVVVIENVRGLISASAGSDVEPCPWCVGDSGDEYSLRALDAVLADLSDLGFDAEWTGIRAADVGAPHGRFRFFLLAYSRGVRLDSWRGAVAGEAAGGWASTESRGRADTPVALFRTPAAAELDGGRRNPDRPGATMRLRDQVAEEQARGILLPTPVAQPSGNTPEQHLAKKPGREVVTDLAILVENGLMPTGGRLLPTPRASRGAASTETMYALGAERDDTGDRQGNVVLPGEAKEIRVDWGKYEPAVRVWESLTRPAPSPTNPDGRNGAHRLAPEFTEWMMGYPAGWVTNTLTRNAAIKACGNGVVPQQAYAALSILWDRINKEVTS